MRSPQQIQGMPVPALWVPRKFEARKLVASFFVVAAGIVSCDYSVTGAEGAPVALGFDLKCGGLVSAEYTLLPPIFEAAPTYASFGVSASGLVSADMVLAVTAGTPAAERGFGLLVGGLLSAYYTLAVTVGRPAADSVSVSSAGLVSCVYEHI